MFKAALFDLDGVVFNTEGQYTTFWSGIGKQYLPDVDHFEQRIKGMTLVQIYSAYFPDDATGKNTAMQAEITKALDEYERHMSYNYVEGFEGYIKALRSRSVKTAVVTSSNIAKMENVYKVHPDFKDLFDIILTSEDFDRSKPDPDCYLKAAARFDLAPGECVGFEDSVNGLKAVKAAQMTCVGLATTNPCEVVAEYADIVVGNYTEMTDIFA